MLSSRPSLRIRRISQDRMILETRPSSRFLYLGVFSILLTSMLLSMDPGGDFTGGRIAGTIVFFLLLLLSLGLALYSWRMTADGGEGWVEIRVTLAYLPLSVRRFPTTQVDRVVLKRAVLLRGRNPKGEKTPAGSLRWIASPGSTRHELGTLYLEVEGKPIRLDSSTEAPLLSRTGNDLAEFLGIPYAEVEE
jgi:hypothetical protein